MNSNIVFASQLKKLRKAEKITQEVLAERLNVTKGSVTMWETSNRVPHVEMLIKIADIFHVSLDYLVLGVDVTKPKKSVVNRRKLSAAIWILQSMQEVPDEFEL